MKCFRLLLTAALLAAVAAGAACTREETGDYFKFDGRLFVFNWRVASANYLVNIKQLRAIEPGHVAVASFEDPAGGPPLVVREKIWPGTTRTTINSPPVQCIVKDKPYTVTIRIEDGAGRLVQELKTEMSSNQDQGVMPDKPLIAGPLYTPNPDTTPAVAPPCPAT